MNTYYTLPVLFFFKGGRTHWRKKPRESWYFFIISFTHGKRNDEIKGSRFPKASDYPSYYRVALHSLSFWNVPCWILERESLIERLKTILCLFLGFERQFPAQYRKPSAFVPQLWKTLETSSWFSHPVLSQMPSDETPNESLNCFQKRSFYGGGGETSYK